ncbi:DNA-directed RNA polymerase III subunit 2-like protein [Tanacetum coccineum]
MSICNITREAEENDDLKEAIICSISHIKDASFSSSVIVSEVFGFLCLEDTDVIAVGEIDKQFLAAPIKSAVDKFQLVPEFLKIRGLVKKHLDSFNYFIKTDLKKIVRANDTVSTRLYPSIYLRYKDVWIGKPSIVVDGVGSSLYSQ